MADDCLSDCPRKSRKIATAAFLTLSSVCPYIRESVAPPGAAKSDKSSDDFGEVSI